MDAAPISRRVRRPAPRALSRFVALRVCRAPPRGKPPADDGVSGRRARRPARRCAVGGAALQCAEMPANPPPGTPAVSGRAAGGVAGRACAGRAVASRRDRRRAPRLADADERRRHSSASGAVGAALGSSSPAARAAVRPDAASDARTVAAAAAGRASRAEVDLEPLEEVVAQVELRDVARRRAVRAVAGKAHVWTPA